DQRQHAQPFMLAALQEQLRRCAGKVVDGQRSPLRNQILSWAPSAVPELDSLCHVSSLQEVTQRCKAACQSPENANGLRQSLRKVCRAIKESHVPAAKLRSSALLERLQASVALRELETDLDQLEASIQAARKSLGCLRRPQAGEVAMKSSRNKARQEAVAEPKDVEVQVAVPSAGPTAPSAKQTVEKPEAAVEKRTPAKTVVINCANVGTVYSESRRQLYAEKLPPSTETGPSKRGFDWDGVRRVFDFYESHGLQPQGVCKFRTEKMSPVPSDLKSRVIVCPVVDDQRDVDDLFTIRLAMRYGCQLVDNDNYRDWKHEEGKLGTSDDIRDWLLGDGAQLKVTY
ncbi:unnamed protein product, partial [Symbiodinium natans]